jgi:tetratricopeptide (TPR) repeat protein
VHAATHAQICGRAPSALELARKALAIYEKIGDLRGQFDSLFLLVDITSNVGEMEASRDYLDAMHQRSTSLADRSIEARALSSAATAELLRQQYRECFDLSKRGLAAYLAINDREGEAFSRGRIAASAACLGDYRTAMREFDLAAQAYESIGSKRGLALTHTNRTVALMRLGQLTEALRSIERSNAMSDVVHEKRTLVANQVNESFINLHLGNAKAAKSLAAIALKNARELGYPVFEAAALANLGNAERVLGDMAAAIGHMEGGLALRRPLQDARDYVDDLADLALAYVAAGRTDSALGTARVLQALGGDGFSGSTWPHYVWWAAAAAFDAAGVRDEAEAAGARARSELERIAGSIEDADARAAMLSVAINRRIAESR